MFEHSGMEFLRTELSTGFTLSRLAQSAKQMDKKRRTRGNARKAYDSVLHFLPTARLTADEAAEVNSKMEELRFELHCLGEKF